MAKQNLPFQYVDEKTRYNTLYDKGTNMTTTGAYSFTSTSSGVTYSTVNSGEYNVFLQLQTVLANYLFTAEDFNSHLAETTAHEFLQTIATTTGTVDLDVSLYNTFDLTLTGNTTLNFTNVPADGVPDGIIVKINQGGTAYTLTFPASVKWGNDSVPDVSAINKTAILAFFTVLGDTRWYGALVNNKYTT